MAYRKEWSSATAAQQYILSRLRDAKDGLTESELNTRHDPNIVTQVLNLLVDRSIITLHIDDNKVGGNRRKYKLIG